MNRKEWEEKGEEVVAEMRAKAEAFVMNPTMGTTETIMEYDDEDVTS